MSGGGDCELYCDLDAMDEIGNQLQSIYNSLDDVDDRVDVYDDRLGSSRIEEAIEDFVGGWRDGRKEIRDMVDASSANVKKAAETYRATEDKLAAAARGEPAA